MFVSSITKKEKDASLNDKIEPMEKKSSNFDDKNFKTDKDNDVYDQSIIKIIQEKTHLDIPNIRSRIDKLVSKNVIESDKKTLTEQGRSSLHVVLTGGVFDIIHPGHVHTLNLAKKLGDVLVVVVATDHTVQKMKKRIPLHSQKQRKYLVESIRVVDLCLIGDKDDIFKTVKVVRPETIALGYDQIHQERFIRDGCKKINLDIKVARLQSPVPEISSTDIEKKYGSAIHGI